MAVMPRSTTWLNSWIPEWNAALPNAARASRQILCLPIYPDLDDDSVERVLSIITGAL